MEGVNMDTIIYKYDVPGCYIKVRYNPKYEGSIDTLVRYLDFETTHTIKEPIENIQHLELHISYHHVYKVYARITLINAIVFGLDLGRLLFAFLLFKLIYEYSHLLRFRVY